VSTNTPYLTDIPPDWKATLAKGSNKSAKPGEWKNRDYTLSELVQGLTQHTIGPKDGACFLQGQAKGGVRNARAMEKLFVVGIDVDNGMPSTEIDQIVRERGVFCIRYTTHSHGKDQTEVKNDDWITYARAHEGATISEYLVAKKRYLPEVAEQARIVAEEMTSDSGKVIIVEHPAMDKNRLIFVLARPWSVWDWELQAEALKAWETAYMSLASWLGIVVDKSCTDTSRLFYLPRREKDALYEAVVHPGKAIDIFALPKPHPSRNAFLDAAAAMGADTESDVPRYLKTWAAKNADRFLIHDALQEYAPNVLRTEKDHDSIRHIECPFESQHTAFGGSGTFVTNAGESPGGGFVIKCMHDSCTGRDRLSFVAEMISQEWLPEGVLTDDAFLIEMEGSDPAPAIEDPKPADEIALTDVTNGAAADAYVRWLAESDTPPIKAAESLNALARRLRDDLHIPMGRSALDVVYKNYVKEFRRLKLEAEEARQKQAKEAHRAERDEEKEKAKTQKAQQLDKRRKAEEQKITDRVTIFVETDHLESVKKALNALKVYNDKDPFIFRSAGSINRISYDEQDHPRVQRMGPNELRYELARVARYMVEKGEGMKETEPPNSVVNDILANPSPPFPILTGIVTAPVFGPDGKITTTPGYDKSSQLFFEPSNGLTIRPISDIPSEGEVAKALDLLMGNALVDFPFDGPHGGQSERAHALCMVLQPFARQLIGGGSTPIYLIVKPTPGTGASKLVNIYSLISTGEDAVAQTETRSEDEIRKRITSVLLEAAPTFYLDNINYRVDSSALASAVTTSMWTDRLLGETKTVRVPVRHTWIFAGNNPTLSNEIARRCVRIRLDAKVERPELRANFKHKDLEGWVRANRAELIWACLTLIQNWIAKGRPEPETVKGSFEPWSRVMGGILKCCGYDGFLTNDGELRDDSDEEGNAIKQLVSIWWDTYAAKPVTVGGGTDGEGLFNIFEDEEIPLPIQPGAPNQQKISFGKYLVKLKNRIFTIEDEHGDRVQVRIEPATKYANKSRWQLTRLD
jgi:hypothetical protein